MKARTAPSSHPYLLWFQAALLTLATAVIMLLPPVRGAMLLVPLTPAAGQALSGALPGRDTRLLGRGPLPHSLIVIGERRDLLRNLLKMPMLVVAAPRLMCSTARAGGIS